MSQTKTTILVIEDEETICNFISTTLTSQGYQVVKAFTGREGLSVITSLCPDVVLLDLGLPDTDGLEIIRQVRAWSAMPILVLSARTREQEKVAALDLGADDYLTKPFGTSELLARIRTALRHHHASSLPEQIYRAGDLTIDFTRRLVTVREQEVHLTQVEYKIVTLLAKNSGRVLTYDSIISSIWGPYADNNNRILRVNMANIRRKLETNPAQPEYIFTEIGVGYRMKENN
jgi:two-component system KDP operon response regulator KdpE